MIHGPSGSGKTCLAKWLAFSCRRIFKFLVIPCAELVHKVVGETEKKISNIFQAARKIAPCFILLDNLDTVLGSAVGDGDGSYKKNMNGRRYVVR